MKDNLPGKRQSWNLPIKTKHAKEFETTMNTLLVLLLIVLVVFLSTSVKEKKQLVWVGVYLLAIVLANLGVAYFGPSATIWLAFLLIGLDLTARDRLHEAWSRENLWAKMFAMIITGSLLSFMINAEARQIAIASCVAFLAAGVVDAITYQFLHNKPWLIKVNGSNVFAALADSLIFPTVAFGAFMPLIVLGEFAAKMAGGFLWSLIIAKITKPEEAPAKRLQVKRA